MPLTTKVDRECPRCHGRYYHRATQIKGCTFEAYCTSCGHQWRVRLRKTRDEFPEQDSDFGLKAEVSNEVLMNATVKDASEANRMPRQMLRERGVYFLGRTPYAALPNDDGGDYAYVLADVEPRGAGYVLKEHQDFGLFVDGRGSLFTVYAKDSRADGKTIQSLRDSGMTVPESA